MLFKIYGLSDSSQNRLTELISSSFGKISLFIFIIILKYQDVWFKNINWNFCRTMSGHNCPHGYFALVFTKSAWLNNI